MHHSAVTTALALSLLACGPGTDPGEPDAGYADPLLVIGTGEGTFHAFADGDTLDLVRGCQGAQHVWVALRAQGIDRRGPIVDVSLVRAADEVVVSQAFRVVISFQRIDGEVYTELYGITLVVPEPDEALGQDLILRATVTDMNDIEIADERRIRIDWGGEGCGELAPG